ATALLQTIVVAFSGSIALLADTIHNFADAATALPLGVAFWLARRGATRRFTYGLGRPEDLAGLAIVVTILASALVAAFGSIARLLERRPVAHLWAVVLASLLRLVWQAARAILLRMLDGVETEILDQILHAASHVARVEDVTDARARWIGHRLHVDVSVSVRGGLTVAEGHGVAKEVRHQLLHHLPHLGGVTVHVDPHGEGGERHHRITPHAHDGLPLHSHD